MKGLRRNLFHSLFLSALLSKVSIKFYVAFINIESCIRLKTIVLFDQECPMGHMEIHTLMGGLRTLGYPPRDVQQGVYYSVR